ncbi:hypothetical protein B484DRAFT_405829 [Ochromonadaceae sp. CCMP2298]|nr:hypothetical protein B484DRAFT_405829 [Ochromonadaceae sp. CCMP2298]
MLYTSIIRVNVAHAAARAASDCASVAEATTAGALGLAPLDWRIDASTVLRVPGKAGSPPANKGPVLKFARNVLQLQSDLDGRELTTCNLPQLLAVVRDWESTNAVCPRTVGSVSEEVVERQLVARFSSPAARSLWAARHIPDTETGPPAARLILQHVLAFSYKLEYLLQPTTGLSKLFQDGDGAPRMYEYLRCTELFVICLLHCQMRIGEKLMNLFLHELRSRADLAVGVKQARWTEVETKINVLLQHASRPPVAGSVAPAGTAPTGGRGGGGRGGRGLGARGMGARGMGARGMGGRGRGEGGQPPAPPTLLGVALEAAAVIRSEADLEDDEFLEAMDNIFSDFADPDPTGLINPANKPNAHRLPAMNSKNLSFRMDWDKQGVIGDLAGMYWAVFTELRRPCDFSPDEVDSVQLLMDQFCRALVSGFSVKDVTNYVHDLQAGHVRYFLRKHGNIYRYANIGLEATIKVLRTFSKAGTQRGGHVGNDCRKPPEPGIEVEEGEGEGGGGDMRVKMGCTLQDVPAMRQEEKYIERRLA